MSNEGKEKDRLPAVFLYCCRPYLYAVRYMAKPSIAIAQKALTVTLAEAGQQLMQVPIISM
jgi:hypothetical protein